MDVASMRLKLRAELCAMGTELCILPFQDYKPSKMLPAINIAVTTHFLSKSLYLRFVVPLRFALLARFWEDFEEISLSYEYQGSFE